MQFSFVKLICTVRLEEEVNDPFILFRCRSHFSDAFRTLVCRAAGNCSSCRLADCSYRLIFGQQVEASSPLVKRHQKPPLPFIFDFPLILPTNFVALIEIGLVLVGAAVNLAHLHVAALEEMKHPRLSLVSVDSVDLAGTRTPFSNKKGVPSLNILSLSDLVASRTISAERLRLAFDCPLRLMEEGRAVRHLDPSLFIRSLLRRVSSLAAYYCGDDFPVDFRWLADSSRRLTASDLHWSDWDNRRQGSLAGLLGETTLTGCDLSEFHPFILMGEYLHLGKGASFGLGRFRILN